METKEKYPWLNAKLLRNKVRFDEQIAHIVHSFLAELNDRIQSLDQIGINAGSITHYLSIDADRFNKKSIALEFYGIVINKIKKELTSRGFDVELFYTVDTEESSDPETFENFVDAVEAWDVRGGWSCPSGDFYPPQLGVSFAINWIDSIESIQRLKPLVVRDMPR